MNAVKEAVLIIYQDEEAVAIVKRDDQSKKTIFYSLKEMCVDDIEHLINRSGINSRVI